MVARLSNLFLRTLREDPADAEVPSHRLLVRAGCIRRSSSGVYSYLPLGKRVLDRVARIVREEMDAIGAQEVLLPALLPAEPWQQTGRYEQYGPLMFRLQDRRGQHHLLGPTAEEAVTLLVKGEYGSYRDLPVSLYQVSNKYRDELRPRSGLIRAREFVMKDAYSFHASVEDLRATYAAFYGAYERIFARCGLDVRVVEAQAGEIGGDVNHEFMAPAAVGEDLFVSCTSCDYAANVEAAQAAPPVADTAAEHPPMETLHTPGVPGVADVVAHLGGGMTAADMLKCLLFRIDGEITAVLVPGDREVDTARLERAVAPSSVALIDAADFEARPDLVKGYAGPSGMGERGVRVLADPRVAPGTSWVTGGNQLDHHVRHAVCARDFTVDETVDVATIAAGDPCPRCGAALQVGRSIEVGHIFQLGTKYSAALDFRVTGEDGSRVPVLMSCYGIGVSRVVASIVEQTCDDVGLRWPPGVAPYDVHLVPLGRDGAALAAAEFLAEELESAGVGVLVDDREVSAGVKFSDADLIGVPTVIVLGKGLATGTVEVKDRLTGARADCDLPHVVAHVRERLPV